MLHGQKNRKKALKIIYQFTHRLALKLYPQQFGPSLDLRLYLSRLEIHDSETCENRHAFGANKSCCCRQVISIYLHSKMRTWLKMWQECQKLTPCPAISMHTVAGTKRQARTEPKNRMCSYFAPLPLPLHIAREVAGFSLKPFSFPLSPLFRCYDDVLISWWLSYHNSTFNLSWYCCGMCNMCSFRKRRLASVYQDRSSC